MRHTCHITAQWWACHYISLLRPTVSLNRFCIRSLITPLDVSMHLTSTLARSIVCMCWTAEAGMKEFHSQRSGPARAWPAVVVAMGGLSEGGKGVALLGILVLGGAALIPHGAA